MAQFHYTAFVRLGSGENDCIQTDVVCDLSEEEIGRLNAIKSAYQGKPHRISQEVQRLASGLHRKLMKGAHDDVECLLTENAVENGYSEVYEEDLYAADCEEGRFTPDKDKTEEESIVRWREEEAARVASMSRADRTAYLTQRYLIELDFDENDYSYFL